MRRFPALVFIPVLVVSMLASGGWARADEGRIPIFGPTVIAQPGHYILTRSFCFASSAVPPCISATSGITIQSSDVILDLNGRTISTAQGQNVIYIDTSSATRGLVVRNGTLIGGGSAAGFGNAGIYAAGTNPVDLKVEGLEIREMGGPALNVNSARSVEVGGCRILDASYGILIVGAAGPFLGIITDNFLTGIDNFGIDLEGIQSGQILRNVVRDFGATQVNAAGILVKSSSAAGETGGNRIEGNTVNSGPRGTDDDGIAVLTGGGSATPHNFILENVVKSNGRYGLFLSSDENRIERNVASHNGSDGIRIGQTTLGARNDLEGNQAQGNSGCGIGFTNFNSHVYRNNVMRNNTGGDVCGFGAPSTNAGGNICTAACP